MQANALCGQFDRKSGWMGTLLHTLVNRLIRNKPSVSSTTFVFPVGVGPALDIGFVCVGNPDSQPIYFTLPVEREMKNILVTVVHESRRVNRLKMPVGGDPGFPFN